jgi:hypothetical protein
MRLLAAGARHAPLVGGWRRKPQQLGKSGSSGAMHGRAHRHLNGFQVKAAGLAAIVEDHPQQLAYFAHNFLADRFSRFFSCGDSGASSTGRSSQICSLTSNN